MDELDCKSRRRNAACINYDLRLNAARINNDRLNIVLISLLHFVSIELTEMYLRSTVFTLNENVTES